MNHPNFPIWLLDDLNGLRKMFQQLVDKAEREPSLLVKIYQTAQARKVEELSAGTVYIE